MEQIAGGYETHRANKGHTFKSAGHGGVPASMNLHGKGELAATRRAAASRAGPAGAVRDLADDETR